MGNKKRRSRFAFWLNWFEQGYAAFCQLTACVLLVFGSLGDNALGNIVRNWIVAVHVDGIGT